MNVHAPAPLASPRSAYASAERDWIVVLGAALLLYGAPAAAQAEPDPVDRSVELVGATISDLADRVDSFLGSERVEDEANQTRLRLTGGGGWVRGDGASIDGRVDLRLSLPRIAKRLSLFVKGTGEDRVEPSAAASGARDEDEVEDRFETSGIGLRYFFIRNPDRAFSADAGFRAKFDFDPFISPRYRVAFRDGPWRLTPIVEGEWSRDQDFGARGLIEADWIDEARQRLFRLSPEIRWEENRPGFGYGGSLRELRLLAPNAAIETVAAVNLRSNLDSQVETVFLGLRYRRTVGWDWLEIEIAPELSFPQDRDFQPTPGLFARLHITFGGEDPPLRWGNRLLEPRNR